MNMKVVKELVENDPQIRTILRAAVGRESTTTMPVQVVAGDAEPRIYGEPAYHTTMSGKTIVHHPASYKYPTIRHATTEHVVVGWQFVPKLLLQAARNWRAEQVRKENERVEARIEELRNAK